MRLWVMEIVLPDARVTGVDPAYVFSALPVASLALSSPVSASMRAPVRSARPGELAMTRSQVAGGMLRLRPVRGQRRQFRRCRGWPVAHGFGSPSPSRRVATVAAGVAATRRGFGGERVEAALAACSV